MEYLKIKDFAEVITGGTPSTSIKEYWENGTVPWIQSGSCKDDIISKADKYITELGLKNSSAKIMPKDTVVIALTGATAGKIGLLSIDTSANQSVTGILPNKKCIPLYLFYYLISIRNKILSDCYGGAQKHISQGYVKELVIPIPEIIVQEKIIDKIKLISTMVDCKCKELNKFDELIKSQFIKMFGDPFINPNKYEFYPFVEYMDRCVDIGSNGANQVVVEHLDMKDEEDYALLIRTLNFTSNDFKNNVKYISKEAYEFFSKSKVYGGEIIFNKIGSAGINFLMPYLNRPVSLGLNQIMITPKNINTRYLYDYLNTEFGKLDINSRVNGAVTKSIQKTELKKIPIMYPPIELQEKYAKIAEQIDKQKNECKESLKKLEEMQSALMQEYFG